MVYKGRFSFCLHALVHAPKQDFACIGRRLPWCQLEDRPQRSRRYGTLNDSMHVGKMVLTFKKKTSLFVTSLVNDE